MHMSQWTFFDYIFVIIMIVSIGFAVTKGLVREITSLVALIGGFILAAFYYRSVAVYFADFTKTDALANLIGFMIIFLGCLILGAILAFVINRFVKMAALQWVDRLLGGVYGLIRGWIIASIIVLALIAFPVRENMLAHSVFAPYLLAGARTAAYLVPQKMKDDFYQGYQKVLQNWNQNRSKT
jgi:membrane protein required for colicin V production